MKLNQLSRLLAASGLASVLLAGCGGGGDSATPVKAAPVAVPVTVIDGAIGNALVCLDLNANGACDVDEPSARTDADGHATLNVGAADAGKYPVLAIVGTDAVDKDHGAVPVPFTLKAPADTTAVISPLTTLVQAHIEAGNTSTAQAIAAVQDQLGMTAPLLMADFTQGTDDASKLAGTLARLIVVTKQEQVSATAGATHSGGAALTQAEIEAAVNARLLQLLPALIQAAADPAVLNAANAADKAAAMLVAAQALAAEAGLTKDNVGAVVAATQQAGTPDAPALDTGAGESLRWFSFTDINNFMIRVFRATAEQAAVDANGKRHFDEYRERASDKSGTLVTEIWNPDADSDPSATPWLRNQVWWTGTEWFDCPATFVHEQTPWSAAGESESLYCKGSKSRSKRSVRDIAGMKLIDVVTEIRAYPLSTTDGKFANWGPDPSDPAIIAALGAQTFPAGSKVVYQTTTSLLNNDIYGTTSNDQAKVYSADLASGEATACAAFTNSTVPSQATTLEELVARSPGVACAYPTNAGTGPTNEAWGQTSVGIGDVVTSTAFTVPGSSYKTKVKRIRAAFGADSKVTYLSCLARVSDNSPRNCTAIGTGSYSIETLGDARVLRLAGAPIEAAAFNYNRSFVERGGKVYYATRDKLVVNNQQRLNREAAEALIATLGLN